MNVFVADIAFALVTASVVALGASAFALQYAVSDVINLALGELLTLGAYVAYAAVQWGGLGLWLGSLVAVMLTGVGAVAMSRFVLAPLAKRGTGLFGLMVVTFAVSIIVQNGLVAIFGASSFTLPFGGQETAVHIGAFVLTRSELLTIVLAIVAVAVLQGLLRATRLGWAIRAIVDDNGLARACGIRTERVSDITWFVSGCCAGVAGLALAATAGSVDSTLGYNYLVYIVPAAVLGGMGNVFGAAIGALVIAFASDWASILIGSEYQDAIALGVLLLIFIVRPTGILAPVRQGGGRE